MICGELRGTHSGYQRHIRAGEPGCQDCKKAKAAYNKKNRKQNPEVRERQKKVQLARQRARQRLSDIYRRDYLVLYNEEMQKLGVL
jgi:hypothetical protein